MPSAAATSSGLNASRSSSWPGAGMLFRFMPYRQCCKGGVRRMFDQEPSMGQPLTAPLSSWQWVQSASWLMATSRCQAMIAARCLLVLGAGCSPAE